MSVRAMPSPKNTNVERRFIVDRRPTAAYDVKGGLSDGLSDEVVMRVIERLREKLSDDVFAQVCTALEVDDPYMSMDDEGGPPAFRGRPTPGGKILGEDARRHPAMDAKRSFAERFPNAARIKVSP